MNEHLARALESEDPKYILGIVNREEEQWSLLYDLIREALLDQKGPAIEAIERALSNQLPPAA
jgi:hypothetical protein